MPWAASPGPARPATGSRSASRRPRLAPEPAAARAFFEAGFVPVLVTDRGNAEGLFTGYYEPLLMG